MHARACSAALSALIVLGPAAVATDAGGEAGRSGGAPAIEEIHFRSGRYDLAGDLVLPGGDGPHPVVIVVAGSGPGTRTSTPGYWDVRQRFLDAGFAVFSWDKPGSGGSSGELVEDVLTHRAAILVDGIEAMATHRAIDSQRIGLWGLSQAGWVMPMALAETDDVAFMLVVSGGGEDSIDQGMYQVGQQLVCRGATAETGAWAKDVGSRAVKATTFDDYALAISQALEIPGVLEVYPVELAPEEDWSPLPRDLESFFDPMAIVEGATIPILAVFGELDRYIDPVQGAAAYATAFETAGNQLGQVELLPGVGHTMLEQQTGCPGEPGGAISARYLELLDDFIEQVSERA